MVVLLHQLGQEATVVAPYERCRRSGWAEGHNVERFSRDAVFPIAPTAICRGAVLTCDVGVPPMKTSSHDRATAHSYDNAGYQSPRPVGVRSRSCHTD
jgi:hypothetical protein